MYYTRYYIIITGCFFLCQCFSVFILSYKRLLLLLLLLLADHCNKKSEYQPTYRCLAHCMAARLRLNIRLWIIVSMVLKLRLEHRFKLTMLKVLLGVGVGVCVCIVSSAVSVERLYSSCINNNRRDRVGWLVLLVN
jgi:hypothetical protein